MKRLIKCFKLVDFNPSSLHKWNWHAHALSLIRARQHENLYIAIRFVISSGLFGIHRPLLGGLHKLISRSFIVDIWRSMEIISINTRWSSQKVSSRCRNIFGHIFGQSPMWVYVSVPLRVGHAPMYANQYHHYEHVELLAYPSLCSFNGKYVFQQKASLYIATK